MLVIGLAEPFSSDAVHDFLYGPTVNEDKAINQGRKTKKSTLIVLYFEYKCVC